MKKNIIFIILLLLLTSCNIAYEDTDIGTFEGVVPKGRFDIDKNNVVLPSGFYVNQELALSIGNAVIKDFSGEKFILESTYIVKEIQDEDIFIVTRFPKKNQLGGDINVAIDKRNGCILKIWGGE